MLVNIKAQGWRVTPSIAWVLYWVNSYVLIIIKSSIYLWPFISIISAHVFCYFVFLSSVKWSVIVCFISSYQYWLFIFLFFIFSKTHNIDCLFFYFFFLQDSHRCGDQCMNAIKSRTTFHNKWILLTINQALNQQQKCIGRLLFSSKMRSGPGTVPSATYWDLNGNTCMPLTNGSDSPTAFPTAMIKLVLQSGSASWVRSGSLRLTDYLTRSFLLLSR